MVQTPASWAQSISSNTSLSVSPSILEAVVSRGQKTVLSVTLTNLSAQPLPLYASAQPFNNQGYIDKAAVGWFNFNQPDLILLPGQSQKVQVGVDTPARAEAGGHYASLYFTPLVPVDSLRKPSTQIISRIGVIVFLIVRGQIIEKASLNQIKVLHINQHWPIQLAVGLNNLGNVHLLPRGQINIYKGRRLVAQLPLQDQVILPHTTYNYRVKLRQSSWLGHYSAQATVVYGSKNIRLSDSKTAFWVVPWHAVLGYGIFAILTWLFYRRTGHRWKKALRILFYKMN